MVAIDDAWLCRQNITRFRGQLAQAPEGGERTLLTLLIAQEQAKLDHLTSSRKSGSAPQSVA
jgi:hypothetical protein